MSFTATRRTWLMAGVAGAAGLVGVGTAWRAHTEALPADGERLAPSFWAAQFDQPAGGRLDLAALKGRPLLLNFWATWCPPCIEELPMIDRFFQQESSNGWQVAGIAIDRPDAVRKFLAKTPVSFPVGIAGLDGTDLVRELGNTGGGLPFTLVLAGDGRVAARKMGKLELTDLDAWRRAGLHS